MKGLNDVIRTVIVNELNRETRRNSTAPIYRPDDIVGIELHWDEGETSDNEDYGLSPRLPSMEIEVALKAAGWPQEYRTVDVSEVFTTLLQAVLQVGGTRERFR